jgi:hypothetical protein
MLLHVSIISCSAGARSLESLNYMKVQIPKLSKHVEPNLSKRLRQCSILAVNFWSVTYFGVFNFGTSYLGAKIKP